ncbi:MAG: response regulator [Oscillospiraceae bacterium]|jgi:signal transduction histidine kinase|nr:response regulator [Oscillospiraceae bacterium]
MKVRTFRYILGVAREQLLAHIPEEYVGSLKEHLYFSNIARFAAQSGIVVALDSGLLLSHLLGSSGPKSPLLLTVLLVDILVMVFGAFFYTRVAAKPYDPKGVFHRTIDVLFVLVYVLSEVGLYLAGPKDMAAFFRLIVISFIAGGVTIMRQTKSFPILFALYLFIFFEASQQGVPLRLFIAPEAWYQFWFVCFACCLIISSTVYSWSVNNYTANMRSERARKKLSVMNDQLELGVNQRTMLLQAVNDISEVLLGSGFEQFDTALLDCMGLIGGLVHVDRVYIWKNQMVGDELYCSQIYEWSGGAEPQQGNELTEWVPFPPPWYDRLTTNQCVNGIVSQLSELERNHLGAQGIMTIVVVPIFIHNVFWGFVGFDDCKNEREFTEVDETILRTLGLLFSSSILRNDMTVRLMSATEEALASSRAKGEFLANISHEIRTPINAITGMSAIARKAADAKHLTRCLDNIEAASRQLLSIINDVLDMSKIEAGKLTMTAAPFDLPATLGNIWSIVNAQALQKGLLLTTDFDPYLPDVVIADDMRLSQVLLNLLSNAIKFTPTGGQVRFAAAVADGQDPQAERVALEFSVTDTGIGIAPDQLAHLFGKFEQADHSISRRFGGTGLGLSISKSIVEMMGGAIDVNSTPGEGSCFTVRVTLERGEPMPQRAEGDLSDRPRDFSGRRALLVEDIMINREIVIAMLETTGLIIEEAENGKIAVDLFTKDPERYDLIFMDLHMPEMDGYTATREIRALGHTRAEEIPIIAMTANAFSEDIERCLEAGMNDHIAKPVNFDDLIDKIGRVLG